MEESHVLFYGLVYYCGKVVRCINHPKIIFDIKEIPDMSADDIRYYYNMAKRYNRFLKKDYKYYEDLEILYETMNYLTSKYGKIDILVLLTLNKKVEKVRSRGSDCPIWKIIDF